MKKCVFQWTAAAVKSFRELKTRVTSQPVLALPYFSKLFQVNCDESRVEIGVVLSQEGKPIVFSVKS